MDLTSDSVVVSSSPEQVYHDAILDNPANHLHWSSYADFLQEQGDPRGDLIRSYADVRQTKNTTAKIPPKVLHRLKREFNNHIDSFGASPLSDHLIQMVPHLGTPSDWNRLLSFLDPLPQDRGPAIRDVTRNLQSLNRLLDFEHAFLGYGYSYRFLNRINTRWQANDGSELMGGILRMLYYALGRDVVLIDDNLTVLVEHVYEVLPLPRDTEYRRSYVSP